MTKRFFLRLRRDRRGVSAVEFALIAPLMLFCYLGVSLLCNALLAQRKANHVASAMGDLAAQAVVVSVSNITDICAAATTIMAPFNTSPTVLQMRVSDITENATTKAVTVRWSSPSTTNCGLAELPMNSTYTGPATALLSPGQDIIMAEVNYTYVSPLQTFNISWLPGSNTFTDVFYLQPRQSAAVTCTDCT